jgi:putative SOS response-associated peptidase YedK
MCYYNGVKVTRSEYIRLVTIEKEIAAIRHLLRPMQSAFEYADYPILKPIDGGKDVELVMAHWELIPPRVRTMKDLAEFRKFPTMNAIGEEMFDKVTYKDAAAKRRCLVLSSGFYEWRHYKPANEKKALKYPYYITVPEKEIFFMAGIYQPWTDKETGETIDTFSLVTTKANALMEQVHNTKKRMPLILPEELAYEWIQDGLSRERVSEIAGYQLPAEQMSAYTIHSKFREAADPTEAFHYAELPALGADEDGVAVPGALF